MDYLAVVATIGHGSPCILLRADHDALPMPEQTGLDFASRTRGCSTAAATTCTPPCCSVPRAC